MPKLACENQRYLYKAELLLSFYKYKYKLQNLRTMRRSSEKRTLFTPDKIYSVDGEADFHDAEGRYVCKIILEIIGHGNHYCDICMELDDFHPFLKNKNGCRMTNREVRNRDIYRLAQIRKNELKPEDQIWEISPCKFTRDYIRKSGVFNYQYEEFLTHHPQFNINKSVKTEREILEMIQDGSLFGFLMADIYAPPDLAKKMEHFPAIFRKAYIRREDLGAKMCKFLTDQGLLEKPKLEYVSAHKGTSLLVNSLLAKWYLDIGMVIENVEYFFEFTPTTALAPFVDLVCEKRYAASLADTAPEDRIIGAIAKTLSASVYGRCFYNHAKSVKVRYVTDKQLLKALYRDKIINVDYVSRECEESGRSSYLYEMKCRPRTINYSSPAHLSAFILSTAKLRLLEMAYDFLCTYFDNSTFDFVCSHTDSLAIKISEKSLEDFLKNCIIRGKEESFEEVRDKYLVNPNNPKSKFIDGLFKKEWDGSLAIFTSSKLYCVWNDNDKIVKYACRSCPSRAFLNSVSIEALRKVLYENKPIIVKYRAFNYILGDMLCEEVSKSAVSCYYLKRRINDDLSTSTLDVE